jgi:autotransporter-associated beta strand protein
MWNVNADANYEVVWGSTYFKPDEFVLQDASTVCIFRIPNKFDLNGATRTIASYATGAGAGRGTCGSLEGVIRDSTAGSAGITKIGPGDLQLTGANTFTGVMTINGGIITASILGNGGAASSVGASSAAASNFRPPDIPTL